MEVEKRKEITAWLCGPREWSEGVVLYQRYGANLRLKKLFAVDDTSNVKAILVEELRKLAGISEIEFQHLPRLAKGCKTPSPVSAPTEIVIRFDEPSPAAVVSEYEPTTDTQKEMIRFRDRFPFLNSPDCPDVLKVLVSDLFTAHANYVDAHNRLQALGDEASAEAAADCEKVVSAYLANREIWEELDYYKEHGEILGKSAKFRNEIDEDDVTLIPDLELAKKYDSARAQESKAKRKLAELTKKRQVDEKVSDLLSYWSARKVELAEELARRKKKDQ